MSTVAVTGMAWSTTLHGDAGSTTGSALVMTAIGLFSTLPAVVCWRALVLAGRHAASGADDGVHVLVGAA